MSYVSIGGVNVDLSEDELDRLFSDGLARALSDLEERGPAAFGGSDAAPRRGEVIILPPDGTRFHSKAGYLTDLAARELGERLGAVMPALGTHIPMTEEELRRMFPHTPLGKFRPHDWRNDVVEIGRLEAPWVEKITGGAVSYDWPAQANKLLRDGGASLVLSIGQVVPHEVIGMANHLKNLFVGVGGKEAIDKSHFAGAAYGMEKMMGRADTPVRALFDEAYRRYSSALPPILYALTVVGRRSDAENQVAGTAKGSLAVRGLFVGFGKECFDAAAALARKVNVDILDRPIKRALVYLDPDEYRTTWLGNKAVYRTRMAMEDGGELLVMAPGLRRFGEDPGIDALIRAHGYRPAQEIKRRVHAYPELAEALSAAAHLIHGSSEGRFTVRYCPGPGVTREEIESVGFQWGDLEEIRTLYDVDQLDVGWNALPDGEELFFVPNPALGLWAERERFNQSE